jgi:SAM-dependent methyltransferase
MTDQLATGQVAPPPAELDPSSIIGPSLQPFTRRMFMEAGLKPGMRVLDLWSGAGDVAFLAREIVGDGGYVAGFDEPSSVAYANERLAYRGITNLEFFESTLEKISFAQQFDAAVGRLVLMYRKEPEEDLQSVRELVRPGGLVMFQELDLLAANTVPPAVRVELIRERILDVLKLGGIDLQMGPKLHSTLMTAGLHDVQMRVDGLIGGAESFLPALLSKVAQAIVPPFHPLDPPTVGAPLEQQIRGELAESGGVMSTALLISAWATVPA